MYGCVLSLAQHAVEFLHSRNSTVLSLSYTTLPWLTGRKKIKKSFPTVHLLLSIRGTVCVDNEIWLGLLAVG